MGQKSTFWDKQQDFFTALAQQSIVLLKAPR